MNEAGRYLPIKFGGVAEMKKLGIDGNGNRRIWIVQIDHGTSKAFPETSNQV